VNHAASFGISARPVKPNAPRSPRPSCRASSRASTAANHRRVFALSAAQRSATADAGTFPADSAFRYARHSPRSASVPSAIHCTACPGLPRLASSVRTASASAMPWTRSQSSACDRVGGGSSTRWQRLRMVAGRRAGSSAISAMTVPVAGSSSVFNSALAALAFIASAGSTIAICRPPNWLASASRRQTTRS
jgi:hypothetical protein